MASRGTHLPNSKASIRVFPQREAESAGGSEGVLAWGREAATPPCLLLATVWLCPATRSPLPQFPPL